PPLRRASPCRWRPTAKHNSSIACEFIGRTGLEELISGARAELVGGNCLTGTKCTEFNSALLRTAPRGSCGLRYGRGLGTRFYGLRRPGDYVGNPGQDTKIKFRHAFLLHRLHLQGITPDRA